MTQSSLTDEEFSDVMLETIKQMNVLKRNLVNAYPDKRNAACAVAVATMIAACMNITDTPTEQAEIASIVNTTLTFLNKAWQLIATNGPGAPASGSGAAMPEATRRHQ